MEELKRIARHGIPILALLIAERYGISEEASNAIAFEIVAGAGFIFAYIWSYWRDPNR